MRYFFEFINHQSYLLARAYVENEKIGAFLPLRRSMSVSQSPPVAQIWTWRWRRLKILMHAIGRVIKTAGDKIAYAVLPDHPVPLTTGKHTRTPVPVAVWQPAKTPDSVQTYDEIEAPKGSLGLLKGSELMDLLLGWQNNQYPTRNIQCPREMQQLRWLLIIPCSCLDIEAVPWESTLDAWQKSSISCPQPNLLRSRS